MIQSQNTKSVCLLEKSNVARIFILIKHYILNKNEKCSIDFLAKAFFFNLTNLVFSFLTVQIFLRKVEVGI